MSQATYDPRDLDDAYHIDLDALIESTNQLKAKDRPPMMTTVMRLAIRCAEAERQLAMLEAGDLED